MKQKKTLILPLAAAFLLIPTMNNVRRAEALPGEVGIAFTIGVSSETFDKNNSDEAIDCFNELGAGSGRIEMKLYNDVVVTKSMYVCQNNELSIDLNGHTLTFNCDDEDNNVDSFITCDNEYSSITINDNSEGGGGKIVSKETCLYLQRCCFTLLGGTIESTYNKFNNHVVPAIEFRYALEEADSYFGGGKVVSPKCSVLLSRPDYPDRIPSLNIYCDPDNPNVFPEFVGPVEIQETDNQAGYIQLNSALPDGFKPMHIYSASKVFTIGAERQKSLIHNFDEKMPGKNVDDYFVAAEVDKKIIKDTTGNYVFDRFRITNQPNVESPTVAVNYPNDVTSYIWNTVEIDEQEIEYNNLTSGNMIYSNGIFESDRNYISFIDSIDGNLDSYYELELTEALPAEGKITDYFGDEIIFDEDNKAIAKCVDDGHNRPGFACFGNVEFAVKIKRLALNRTPVDGESSSTLATKAPGRYSCAVTFNTGYILDSKFVVYEQTEIEETVIEKEGVKIELNIPEEGNYKPGFDPSKELDLKIKVIVEAKVSEATKIVDYNQLPETVKIKDNEKISTIFSVKLIQTIDGVEKEIQPSDIKEGTTIKVAMKLPNDIDINKVARILHVHSATDIEEIAFDKSKVNNGCYEITIDRLSEFAFVSIVDNQPAGSNDEKASCWLHWIMIVLVVALGAYGLVIYFVNNRKFEFDLTACIAGGAVLLINAVLGIIGATTKCVACIVMIVITIAVISVGIGQNKFFNKDHEKEDGESKAKELEKKAEEEIPAEEELAVEEPAAETSPEEVKSEEK